jgi:photosystem II stability/assembly factor-like uncharacterized protein
LFKEFLLTTLLLIGFSESCSSHPNNFWKQLNSPTTSTLRNCVFTDRLNGWAAGDDGVIIHTSDGGNTFIIQENPVNYYINDIFFLNKRLGWVVSNEFLPGGSTIITTTNGGTNWIAERFPDTTILFRTVYFLDSLNGYLAGYGGAICKTTNGGMNWISAEVDTSEFSGMPINRIAFINNEIGFACGGFIDVAGVIWRTTNSGYRWVADDYSPEPFYDLFIRDQNKIISVGGDFEYGVMTCKTTNAGLKWLYENISLFGQAYSIDFRTPSEIWMPLGYAESWALSLDTGATWTSVATVNSANIYSVDFVDSLNGWAVGAGGVILKYDPTMVSLISPDNSIPNSVELMQNYPNPFNPGTSIRFKTTVKGLGSLSVFDISGKVVARLLENQEIAEGVHSVSFEASDLASGMYFYKLEFTPLMENSPIVLSKRMAFIK